MDFKVLKGKDPTGEKAEELLRSGHKYPLNAKQKRIEEKNKRRQEQPRLPTHFDSLRSNRNKRHEVEKYQQIQGERAEQELDAAHEQRLLDRNLPMVRKTEKNRMKRQKKKLQQAK